MTYYLLTRSFQKIFFCNFTATLFFSCSRFPGLHFDRWSTLSSSKTFPIFNLSEIIYLYVSGKGRQAIFFQPHLKTAFRKRNAVLIKFYWEIKTNKWFPSCAKYFEKCLDNCYLSSSDFSIRIIIRFSLHHHMISLA